MAAVGVGNKYDVALNGVGYRLKGLDSKRDLPVFAARFSTGEQGEGDLDTWKTVTQKLFDGGILGTNYDPEAAAVYSMVGLFPDPTDGKIKQHYVKASVPTHGTIVGTINSTPIFCNFRTGIDMTTYVGINTYDAGLDNAYVLKYEPSNRDLDVMVGVPVIDHITDMFTAGGFLYVIADGKIHSYNGSAWTTKATSNIYKGCLFNNKLYFLTTTNYLQSATIVTASSISLANISQVGDTINYGAYFAVYNHRLYILKSDGLWTYDGVVTSDVLTFSQMIMPWGMAVFNGRVYWTEGLKNLWAFNGATIELVKVFPEGTEIASLSSSNDHLIIPTNNLGVLGYDGSGIYPLADCSEAASAIALGSQVIWANNLSAFFIGGILNYYYDPDPVVTSHFISSIFDCSFPNITKFLESASVDVEGLGANDKVAVYFKSYDGSSWDSTWRDLGDITNTSGNTLSIADVPTLIQYADFKKLQLKIEITHSTSETIAISGFSFDYYLAPGYKREWRISLLCVGTAENPLELLDGTQETKYANALRENVYDARALVPPVGFEDVDYTRLNGALTDIATTVTVDDTDTFPAAGYIKIDDEIIKYTGKTATQFTGCTRGALGTTGVAHLDNAITNLYYRVIVSEIVNEEVYPPAEGPISPAINYNESIISIVLKEA